jgi:bifunctional N-acetylglucosamine-1-phosphate-uridyltransferase/glucosamine-1-phosphate-acetyltransferase GlmU-like protein
MINVLLPAMGTSTFYKDSFFPKPLYEINGKTMLEHVIDNYADLNPKQYVFVFAEEDCLKFHLDSSAQILSPASKVIKLRNQTAGALCTCLMAIEYINDETPLIIANADQIILEDYRKVINRFIEQNDDAGIITFPSIHPRWSYARKSGDEVVEVAEKRPLSRDAIAGFYYYKQGKYFIEAAEKAILKRSNLNGRYYISSSINELILAGKKIGYYDIKKEQYRSFYSPAKVKEYEDSLK